MANLINKVYHTILISQGLIRVSISWKGNAMRLISILILSFLTGCVSKPVSLKQDVGGFKMEGKLVSSFKCRLGNDERFFAVLEKESGGCELSYVKFGEKKSIATSIQGTEHCAKVLDRTKAILESAKFQCG
ncbi:MAG: hypothetical protein EB078_00165 [Proteobacteria bacterium]|nr:hypothetical protein [Pseudomonadota bacterium]NDD03294.1 hypothetical protein [Pseudomonadota bacterium]NDG26503.1 hypothetical protein [Pseudomonadota bacterium]